MTFTNISKNTSTFVNENISSSTAELWHGTYQPWLVTEQPWLNENTLGETSWDNLTKN